MQNDASTPSPATRRPVVWLLAVIAVVLVGWALHTMQAVFVPIVCAIFAALLVFPVDKFVVERVPGRLSWVGHAAALAVILLVLGLFFGGIWLAAELVAERFPQVFAEASQALPDSLSGDGEQETESSDEQGASPSGADSGRALFAQVSDAVRQVRGSVGESAVQFAQSLLGSATALFFALVLIVFLTLLLLVETQRWRSKLGSIEGTKSGEWLASIGMIASKVRRYLLARTILGVLTAALYTAWLWIFGIDLLIVWALLTLLLNYIPNLGSLISGALPVVYAFLTKDLQTAALVGVGILAIEQVVGNFVDPRVQGRQVSVSPFVVLVALILWGWIWGVAGAVLAVPVTIALLVTFAHVPALQPLALLISNERDMDGLADVTHRQPPS